MKVCLSLFDVASVTKVVEESQNGANKSVKGLYITRKYPLRGYILGVLTHTTAWDQNWGGDGTLTMWFLN